MKNGFNEKLRGHVGKYFGNLKRKMGLINPHFGLKITGTHSGWNTLSAL